MAKEGDCCHVANNKDQNREIRETDEKRTDGHEIGGRNG